MDNRLTEEERVAVAHALRAEIERVKGAGGTQYGTLTIPRAMDLLSRISRKREDERFGVRRIANPQEKKEA